MWQAIKAELKDWWSEQTIPLRRHIFVLFAVPFMVFFCALMWVAEQAATRVAVDGAKTQFAQVGQRTAESLTRLHAPAQSWLAAMTQNPAQGLKGSTDLGLIRVHMSLLDRFEQLASVYFGYPEGEFARVIILTSQGTKDLVKAPEKARFAIQTIRTGDGPPAELWAFYDEGMDPVGVDPRPFGGFDPRTRNWFKVAAKSAVGETVPTSPYVFTFPRQLGVTMSANLGATSGGVGGVDFTLMGLSRYLTTQRGSQGVQSFIFDESGALWAWSNAAGFAKLSANNRVPSVSDLPDASLKNLVAAAKLRANRPDAAYFELEADGGTPFVASMSVVSGMSSAPVYVAVVDERADVFASVYALRWRMLAIGLAGVIGGSLVIAWLSGRLARPLRRLAIQTKLLERFRFNDIRHEPSHVAEVRQLQSATILARAALSGYARFVPKPLVQHYLALRREPKPGVESREVVAMHGLFGSNMQFDNGPNAHIFEAFATFSKGVEVTRGIVDRIDNNGAGALWNAPLIQSNPALRACEAAFQIIEELDSNRINDTMPWPLHIAITTGVAAVGNFGTEDGRLIYTAVGPPVEAARTWAQLGKARSVPLLVSGLVADVVRSRFTLERMAVVQADASDPGVALWQVTGRVAGMSGLPGGLNRSSTEGWHLSSQEEQSPRRQREPRSLNSSVDWASSNNASPDGVGSTDLR